MAKELEQMVAKRFTCLLVKKDVFDAIQVAFDGFCEGLRACGTVRRNSLMVREQYLSFPLDEVLNRWVDKQMEMLLERMEAVNEKRYQLISMWERNERVLRKIHTQFDKTEDHKEAAQDLNSTLEEVSNAVQSIIRLTSKISGELAVSYGFSAA